MSEENNKDPTWWEKRTKLEKRMFITSGVALIAVVIIFIAYASMMQRPYKQKIEPKSLENVTAPAKNKQQELDPENTVTGLSPSYVHAASKALQFLDESANPCDNFYQFACGGFLKNTIIPEDASEVSSTQTIRDTVDVQFKTIMEQPLIPEEPKAFKIVKRLYHLCMDTSGIEADGFKPLNSVLKYLGGWPVLEGNAWKENEFDWKEIIYKLRKSGLLMDSFFTVLVEKADSNKNVLKLTEPALEVLGTNFNNAHVQAYFNFITDVAVALGANKMYAQNELKQSIQFEMELKKIWVANDNPSSQILTISELQQKVPYVQWLEFFENIVNLPDVNITLSAPILVDNLKYFEGLYGLLRRTPKRVQANFAVRSGIRLAIRFLVKQLRDREKEYMQQIVEVELKQEPRWKECTEVVVSWLGRALSTFYIRTFLDDNIKGNLTQMVQDIREQFTDVIQKSDWMDKPTKKIAIEKLEALKTYVAHYSDDLLDNDKLEQFYKDLEADYDSYLTLILKIQIFKYNHHYRSLKDSNDIFAWTVPIHLIDSHKFYYAPDNSIDIPAVALQNILYDNERPKYMNYAAIGQIISHELVHGFDELGKEYDKNGNMEKWWTETTEKKFYKKETCVIEQYDKITEPRLKAKLNGTNTKRENIADITGIKLAYLAYNSWLERNGPEPLLPGLNYNQKQMFWISAANVLCEKRTIESLQKQITQDFYSPANYRVQIAFANSPNFAVDFDCPKGSVMNPNYKCQIW